MNIGSKVERIHPVARFIKDRSFVIIAGWVVLLPIIGIFTLKVTGVYKFGTIMGLGILALMVVPFAVNFFLLRLFPVYRITDCPYCGFHEKQYLGRTESGEL